MNKLKPETAGNAPEPWAVETMRMINELTPNVVGKAFDPDWFLLRQRLEEAERKLAASSQEAAPPECPGGDLCDGDLPGEWHEKSCPCYRDEVDGVMMRDWEARKPALQAEFDEWKSASRVAEPAPSPATKETPPINDELIAEIARELYDRFLMGGWEPQDAYPQIRTWLSYSSATPAKCEKCNAKSAKEACHMCIGGGGNCPIVDAGWVKDWPTQVEFEDAQTASSQGPAREETPTYPPQFPKETEDELQAAHFYETHDEYWIHPLAASTVCGDRDRATIRVHKAMAAFAAQKDAGAKSVVAAPQPEKKSWISVEEKLPDPGDLVLVAIGEGNGYGCDRIGVDDGSGETPGEWVNHSVRSVTAWRDIPYLSDADIMRFRAAKGESSMGKSKAEVVAAPQFKTWSVEDYRRSADVHQIAEQIIRRVVSNVLELAHDRHSLEDIADSDPIDKAEFIEDGLQVALGEDTGCLDPDSLSAENCEVLYVEQELRELLKRALAGAAALPLQETCPSCQASDHRPYIDSQGQKMRACGRCMIQWVTTLPASSQ